MPYLNLDPNFFGHPKYVRLVQRLGERAEGYLLRLWCHAALYHPVDGGLDRYQPEEIARLAGWGGDPSDFLRALIDTGFVDAKKGAHHLHDWNDHQGHLVYLKKRALKGAQARWKKIGPRHAKAMLKQCEEHESSGKVRKGKVRKGKGSFSLTLKEKKGVRGEKEGHRRATERKSTFDEAIANETFKRAMQEAHPNAQWDHEVSKMRGWLIANPRKAKKTNWTRFINGWLGRAEDDRRGIAASQRSAAYQTGCAPSGTEAERAERRRRLDALGEVISTS